MVSFHVNCELVTLESALDSGNVQRQTDSTAMFVYSERVPCSCTVYVYHVRVYTLADDAILADKDLPLSLHLSKCSYSL